MAKSDENSIKSRRARVRGSPGETLPCALMAPDARKLRRGCSVLQVPIQIITLREPKRGIHPLSGG